ncbi:cytochrome b561 and DOMON domain-containing protein At3g07570-like isoform X1 [Magnolia sinica]|uniref:cytochrome b561 and DOMON domain-containing protein At3g07570-like isoform X1 n=1 Tax=Magnolia sinica TaxID=86752 RepID=UPI00265B0341|nr:cytochrome b561 and DOMON domain-containing protein At3g07570-like isoform X1 [Magnolia sinica]
MEMKMSVLSILFLVFFFQLSSLGVSQLDSCNSNLNLNSDAVPFNTTSLRCNPVWGAHGFILRYAQSGPSLWSFVLSAPDPNSYVAMGFSNNGQMIGSSAIVGWILTNGTAVVKQYLLKAKTESQVLPDQGDLPLINGSTVIISQSSRLYIIFQLNTVQPLSNVIYSMGPSNVVPLSNGILSKHQDKVSTRLDFVTGQSSMNAPYTTLRRSHGILNMVGWGILMPIGAIFARYFKEWDPYWFYAHVFIQAVGFGLGLSGAIIGFSLEDKLSVNVDTHKALGILILAFGCLQGLDFVADGVPGATRQGIQDPKVLELVSWLCWESSNWNCNRKCILWNISGRRREVLEYWLWGCSWMLCFACFGFRSSNAPSKEIVFY